MADKVEKVTYLDPVLDGDLIDYLKPYYDRRRGNDELLRLARIGLQLIARGATSAPGTVKPAAVPPPQPRPRPVRQPDEANDNPVQRARDLARRSFGGFD